MGLTGGLDELSFDGPRADDVRGPQDRPSRRCSRMGARRRASCSSARAASSAPAAARSRPRRRSTPCWPSLDGSFSFEKDPGLDARCRAPAWPWRRLLMEGMRRMDETRRLRKRLPAPAHRAPASAGEAQRPSRGPRARLPRSRRAPPGRRRRRRCSSARTPTSTTRSRPSPSLESRGVVRVEDRRRGRDDAAAAST